MRLKTVLSKSEYDVAYMVSQGFIEKEIADKRFVSLHTIRAQTATIRKKLKARNAVDIARKFILSHENPKRLYIALVFLTIQSLTMIQVTENDMRRPKLRRAAYRISKIK